NDRRGTACPQPHDPRGHRLRRTVRRFPRFGRGGRAGHGRCGPGALSGRRDRRERCRGPSAQRGRTSPNPSAEAAERKDAMSDRDGNPPEAPQQRPPHSTDRIPEKLAMQDAEVLYYRTFFAKPQSDSFYEDLLRNADWKQERIKLYGKSIDLPRLTAWHGEEGNSYHYSG